MTGEAVAHYDGKREVVNIQHVILLTPQSSTEVTGVLGVNQGDPLTDLKADMTVRDLGEFDQLLQTLDFEANGKKGTAAVPVVLHGAAGVPRYGDGPGGGSGLEGPRAGHALEVKLGTELDTLIDSVVADAEYSYDEGLAVASSTIKRGTAVLNVGGEHEAAQGALAQRRCDLCVGRWHGRECDGAACQRERRRCAADRGAAAEGSGYRERLRSTRRCRERWEI